MKIKINVTRYEYNNTYTEELCDYCQPSMVTIADAVAYLRGDGIRATINSDGVTFSPEMRELPHNCYSAPNYEIVSAKSGRSNATIRAAIKSALLAN